MLVLSPLFSWCLLIKNKTQFILLVFCLLLIGGANKAFAMPSWLKGSGAYIHVDSHTYSENMPIDAFDNDFQGDTPREGEHAFTFNQYELGVVYDDWFIARTQRFDYFFTFNRDTFDLFYLDGNGIDIPLNVAYDVYLDVQKVETEGVKFGRAWKLSPEVSLRTAVNYFEADDILYGELKGRIWQSPSRIRGDLDLDYMYMEDVVLDRPQISPFTGEDIGSGVTGHGHSFDVSAYWQYDLWRVEVDFFDISGRIDWKNAPYTTATMVSNRNRVDENGNPYKVPTLTSKEWFRDATQVLPTRRRAQVEWGGWHNMTFSAEHQQIDQVKFNRVYMGYQPYSWFKVRGGFDFRSSEKSIELWTPYFSLLAGTDRTDLKQSRNIRLNLSLGYYF